MGTPDYSLTVTLGAYTISGALAGSDVGVQIITCGEDSRSRRRAVATSPYFDDGVELTNVRETGSYTLAVRCVGADAGAALALSDDVVAAVEQHAFTLTEALDGHVETWKASAADWTRDRKLLTRGVCEITATIPIKK